MQFAAVVQNRFWQGCPKLFGAHMCVYRTTQSIVMTFILYGTKAVELLSDANQGFQKSGNLDLHYHKKGSWIALTLETSSHSKCLSHRSTSSLCFAFRTGTYPISLFNSHTCRNRSRIWTLCASISLHSRISLRNGLISAFNSCMRSESGSLL